MISKASALRRSNSLRLNGSKLLLALFARGSFLHLNLIAIGSMTRDIESAPNENETSTGSARQVLVDFLPTVEKQPTLSAGRKILVAAKAAHYRQPQSFGDMVLPTEGL
jgi:hypothetical protein